MDTSLKDILEGDFRFVLVHGEYYDCPTCNDGASMYTSNYYDEKDLLQGILKVVGTDKLLGIWVLDDNGNMLKYSDIHTSVASHRVTKIAFDLPSGRVIIVQEKGGYRQLTPAEVVLHG